MIGIVEMGVASLLKTFRRNHRQTGAPGSIQRLFSVLCRLDVIQCYKLKYTEE